MKPKKTIKAIKAWAMPDLTGRIFCRHIYPTKRPIDHLFGIGASKEAIRVLITPLKGEKKK